jgi:hypothetical protein
MELTLENKLEIVEYIGGVPRYQETFDELYDHVITALGNSQKEEFDLELVKGIVEDDFGGFELIAENEEESAKAFMRACKLSFKEELIRGFRFPGVFVNAWVLMISYILYLQLGIYAVGMSLLVITLLVTAIIPLIRNYFRLYITNRTRKPSVQFKVISPLLIFWVNIITLINVSFLGHDALIHTSSNMKHIIAAAIFFLFSNFILAYNRMYNKRFRVLV